MAEGPPPIAPDGAGNNYSTVTLPDGRAFFESDEGHRSFPVDHAEVILETVGA